MSHSVYIFNPEHDLALANSDANFVPPLMAQKLAADLSVLPIWYCQAGSAVIAQKSSKKWFECQQQLFEQLKTITLNNRAVVASANQIEPWGWNKVISKQLSNVEFPAHLMPTQAQHENIKKLSHRRMASALLAFLRTNIQLTSLIPCDAQEFYNLAELTPFVYSNLPVILKAPLSGSGKGICWVCKSFDKSQIGWCENVMTKQGSVMAEKVYTKVQDFALLFQCCDTQVTFAGYSLFETVNGIYRSNALLSNAQIEAKLISLGVEDADLQLIRNLVKTFIDSQIAPTYTGVLGVDMFVYTENGSIKIHPSVEINLRTTMGFVARRFYDQFVAHLSTGNLYVDFEKNAQTLFLDHQLRKNENPVCVKNNRLVSGYYCASDINPQSQYRLRIEISNFPENDKEV